MWRKTLDFSEKEKSVFMSNSREKKTNCILQQFNGEKKVLKISVNGRSSSEGMRMKSHTQKNGTQNY